MKMRYQPEQDKSPLPLFTKEGIDRAFESFPLYKGGREGDFRIQRKAKVFSEQRPRDQRLKDNL
jgi:hypothetical protein